MERQEFSLKGGGRLTVWEDAGVIHLRADCDHDERGLYKVWAHGPGGRMLVGTLAPEGEGLHLSRRISRRELERAGCWPVTGGERVLAFAFEPGGWRREVCPERLVSDVVLRQALEGQCVLLWRGRSEFRMAIPFEPNRPFLLVPLFCLGAVERVEGRVCVVFAFDRQGNPVLPHKERMAGEHKGIT